MLASIKTSPGSHSNVSSPHYSHEAAVSLCETGLTALWISGLHYLGDEIRYFFQLPVMFRIWEKCGALFKHGLSRNKQRIPVEHTNIAKISAEEVHLS